MKATVFLRNGRKFISQTTHGEGDNPTDIGRRMASGFMILEDSLWQDVKRTLIINLSDVSVVELVEDSS